MRGLQRELIKNFLRVGDREPCSQAPPSFPSFAIFSFVHGENLTMWVVDIGCCITTVQKCVHDALSTDGELVSFNTWY